jgi:hypothetical protein
LPLETGAGVLETVQLRSLSTTLAICGALAALGCERSASALLELPAPVAETAPAPPAVVAPPPPSAPPEELTLIAGGDVSFGRGLGQELLRDPQHDPFAPSATLLASADARFVNLESQLSDQRGETQSPFMELVFTGPPAGGGVDRARCDERAALRRGAYPAGVHGVPGARGAARRDERRDRGRGVVRDEGGAARA